MHCCMLRASLCSVLLLYYCTPTCFLLRAVFSSFPFTWVLFSLIWSFQFSWASLLPVLFFPIHNVSLSHVPMNPAALPCHLGRQIHTHTRCECERGQERRTLLYGQFVLHYLLDSREMKNLPLSLCPFFRVSSTIRWFFLSDCSSFSFPSDSDWCLSQCSTVRVDEVCYSVLFYGQSEERQTVCSKKNNRNKTSWNCLATSVITTSQRESINHRTNRRDEVEPIMASCGPHETSHLTRAKYHGETGFLDVMRYL